MNSKYYSVFEKIPQNCEISIKVFNTWINTNWIEVKDRPLEVFPLAQIFILAV